MRWPVFSTRDDPMEEEILKVENLKKYFFTRRGTVRAVDTIGFSIKEGETFGLVGESGSGKTTGAHTIIGVYRPTEGRASFK